MFRLICVQNSLRRMRSAPYGWRIPQQFYLPGQTLDEERTADAKPHAFRTTLGPNTDYPAPLPCNTYDALRYTMPHAYGG